MQIRITNKEVLLALRLSAKENGRSIPKENEYLLKLVLNIRPKGLTQR